MLKLLLITLITLTLCADTNKYVPAGAVMENAKLVAEKGWKSANKELINHIERNKDCFLKEFLVLDDEPYSTLEHYNKKDDVSLIPYFNQNYYALAIINYFESIGESKKAIYLYEQILSKLKNRYYSYPSGLGLMYRQVVEERTVQSLLNSVDTNVYSKSDLQVIKKMLDSYLLVDLDVVYTVFDADLKDDHNLMYPVLRNDCCATSFYDNIILNLKFSNLLEDVIVYNNQFFARLKAVTSEAEYSVLKRQYEFEKNQIRDYEASLDRYSTCEILNDEKLKNKLVKIFFYKSMNRLILYEQIQKRIKKNKETISHLDTFSTNVQFITDLKNERLIDMRDVLNQK